MMPEDAKSARLEARLPEPVLDMLRHAASIQGRSLSDFVVCSAREAAERAIAEYEVLVLSVADQKLFSECLLSPEPVAEPLERAADRRRRLVEPS